MDKGVRKEVVGENAHKKIVGSRDRYKRRVCAKEGKGVSIVKERKRRGEEICEGTVAERLHLAVKVTANSASVLYRKEGWEEEEPTPFDFRHLGEYWDEEGVYKDGFEVGLQQCKDQGK